LNFAENLLFPTTEVDEDAVAVIAATEESRERVTWRQLREKVRMYAAALSGKVQAGDRVVGGFLVCECILRGEILMAVQGLWETTLKLWLRCWPPPLWVQFGPA
jgi:hypothetical protein